MWVRRILALLCLGIFASGCATIASESEIVSNIQTKPAGAACVLTGEHGFRIAFETPAQRVLDVENAPYKLSCRAPGYFESWQTLFYEHDGWVFGNILIGGALGLVVDSMTQSGKHLPKDVRLRLHPSVFETHSDIDAYYDPLILQSQIRWTKLKEALRLSCNEANCDDLRHRAEVESAAEQNALKAYRAAASVAP